MKAYTFIFLFLFTTVNIIAQIDKPSLSPKVVSKQKVGLANFTLEYGQPSKNNRKIFGSLIPYNKIWRTGANASTKITLDKEASFANTIIPIGTYGLYTIPGKKEWTIIIHKKSNLWGAGNYQKENDLVRFTTPVKTTIDTYETLNIRFENFTVDGADLIIVWENSKITIPVKVDSDAIIKNQINEKILNAKKDIKPQTYFDAAQYYYQKNIDLETAFNWFVKASELKPNAFWYTYYKAELANVLNKKEIAKAGALKCLKDAKNSKSSDYGYISKCELLLKAIQE